MREQVGRYELTILYSCMKLSKNKFKTNINYYIILFPRNTFQKGKSILQCEKSGHWLSREEGLPRDMRALHR